MTDIAYRTRLGERIAEARKLRGLTGRDLAHAAGISPSYLSRIEHAERAVDTVLLRRLADVLEVTMDDLFPRQAAVALLRIGRSNDKQIQEMIDFAQRLREDIDVVEQFADRI